MVVRVIRETCSCGAKFESDGPFQGSSADLWRRSHKHPANVGACDSRARHGGKVIACVLDSGHTGIHTGAGLAWGYTQRFKEDA